MRQEAGNREWRDGEAEETAGEYSAKGESTMAGTRRARRISVYVKEIFGENRCRKTKTVGSVALAVDACAGSGGIPI